jgi:hypothetical protein
MILLIVSADGAAGHQRSCLDGFSDPDIAPTVSSWFPLPFMRPDTGTHDGWRCCDYFEKSWDPGSKSTPELPGCVRGWSAVSRRTHPVRHSVAEEPSPATPIAKCTRAGPPPNRRSRPNCDIGSGVVALGELQQLLRTGEITARLNQVSETRRLRRSALVS